MDRKKVIKEKEQLAFFNNLNKIHSNLGEEFGSQFNRSLPFNDEVFDRWDRGKLLNFGKGSSIYDSSYVFGAPRVGRDVWIGPFTVIDGSGGLKIGDNVTVSAGVHIYTHDNLKQTLLGKKDIETDKAEVKIGNCTYVGPNVVISKGVTLGEHCVVGVNSFVNKSFEDFSIIAGTPAKCIGKVQIENDSITYNYFDK